MAWRDETELPAHREVELERVRQQEHAVGSPTALKVGKVHRGQLADEPARRVVEAAAREE